MPIWVCSLVAVARVASLRHSSTDQASGFCTYTCLPRSMAASAMMRVRVIGRGDHHRVDVLLLLEHLAVVGVALRLRNLRLQARCQSFTCLQRAILWPRRRWPRLRAGCAVCDLFVECRRSGCRRSSSPRRTCATMFWLTSACRLARPMPPTPTRGDVDAIAGSDLRGAAEHVARAGSVSAAAVRQHYG